MREFGNEPCAKDGLVLRLDEITRGDFPRQRVRQRPRGRPPVGKQPLQDLARHRGEPQRRAIAVKRERRPPAGVERQLPALRHPRRGEMGADAGKEFVNYKGRVYDIHLKDKKTEKTADGKSVILDVMVGTGDANYKGLLAELKKAKWPGVMAIETDNATFAKEPSEFVAGAIKFVKDNSK